MQEVQTKNKHLVGTIIAVLVFILLGLFALRVLFLYNKMLQGEVGDGWIGFDTEMTLNQAADSIAVGNLDIVDVVTEDDPSLGSHEAELTIVEFGDFNCPYCARVSYSVRRLASKYGDQVRFIFRDFPISETNTQAQTAAEAAGCAHEQGKFWEYHDRLYQNQGDFSYESLGKYARQVGLDADQFAQCLAEERYRDEVLADLQDGVAAGVVGTPTFFFNGVRIQGAIPDELFETILTAFLLEASTN